MRLTAVQLDAYFASHTLIDFRIDFQQSVDTDILRKKHLGFVLWCGNSAACTFETAHGNSPQRDGTCLQKIATLNLPFHVLSPLDRGLFRRRRIITEGV